MFALGLLGNNNPSLGQQTSIMATSIFKVSLKDQGWPDLIAILCNACNNGNIEFKITTINTLGMIFENYPKELFSLNELALMENTISNLLGNPEFLLLWNKWINYLWKKKNDCIFWCFNKLSKHHGRFFIENDSTFSFFISLILSLLNEQNFENIIKIYFGESIFNLVSLINENMDALKDYTNYKNWTQLALV